MDTLAHVYVVYVCVCVPTYAEEKQNTFYIPKGPHIHRHTQHTPFRDITFCHFADSGPNGGDLMSRHPYRTFAAYLGAQRFRDDPTGELARMALAHPAGIPRLGYLETGHALLARKLPDFSIGAFHAAWSEWQASLELEGVVIDFTAERRRRRPQWHPAQESGT